jgi:hypothetical protein
MDYRSLSSLALRLAGVLIVVHGIAGIPDTFIDLYLFASREIPESALRSALLASLLAGALPLFLGLMLIYFPSVVANRVVPTDAIGREGSLAYQDLQALAFSVLGVYFIAMSLYDAVYWVAKARVYYMIMENAAGTFPNPPALLPDDFGGFVYAGVRFLGGVILLLGGRGLSGLLQRLRGRVSDER